MKRRLFLVSTAVLLLSGCEQGATSPNSGGSSAKTSTFYLQNGKAAGRAAVTIYAAGTADSLPEAKTYTDGNGNLVLPTLPKGYYSLVVRDSTGQAVFLDSIFSTGTDAVVPSDTLHLTGSLVGQVKVQPQDDPRIAWVALLGTGLFANLDDSGKFSIAGIPDGRYTMMATTNNPQYTSTFLPSRVRWDSTTDLGTIPLVYTGVPVVGGITGTWDSVGEIIHLRWDTTGQSKATGFRIYKGNSNDPSSEKAVAFVNAGITTWADTVFRPVDSMAGKTEYVHYQVAAVKQDGTESPRWYSWSDTVRSPDLVAQVAATWSLMSSNLPSATCRLDTLPGNLLLIDNGPDGSVGTSANLSVSPDGLTWRKIRSEPDSENAAMDYLGMSNGVVFQGLYWWIRPWPTTRSVYLPDTFATPDSFKILSIDANGLMDSTTIAAFSGSESAYRLVVDTAGLVLLEGEYWLPPTANYGMFVAGHRLKMAGGGWKDGTWATWFTPVWYNGIARYPSLNISPKGQATLNSPYGNWYLDQDVQMFEIIPAGMYYTTTPSTPHWKRVLGSPGNLRTLTSFQGSVWTLQSDSLWKVSLP